MVRRLLSGLIAGVYAYVALQLADSLNGVALWSSFVVVSAVAFGLWWLTDRLVPRSATR